MGFPDSSVGKESACNAGVPGSISTSRRSVGEGIGYHSIVWSFSCGSTGKESICNVGSGSDPWIGKIPGEGKGYPL